MIKLNMQATLDSVAPIHTLFLELKECNRCLHELTEEAMRQAQQKSDKLNDLTLQLQNLQYERGHYLREIKQCQSYG